MSQIIIKILLLLSICCIVALCVVKYRRDKCRPHEVDNLNEENRPVFSPIESSDDAMVNKAMKYVEANLHRPDLSVEQLSVNLGVSRVHLYNKLKGAVGLTPIEFIRTIRLRRAARMLREGEMSVSEIAAKVGFNTPRNFSKYFRDEYGMLPSQYQTDNNLTEP